MAVDTDESALFSSERVTEVQEWLQKALGEHLVEQRRWEGREASFIAFSMRGDGNDVVVKVHHLLSASQVLGIYRTHVVLQEGTAASGRMSVPEPLAVEPDQRVLVTRWCNGRPINDALWDALVGDDPMVALALMQRVGQALGEYHRALTTHRNMSLGRGLRHGDCHPHNLLIDETGQVTLLDLPFRLESGSVAADLGSLTFHTRRLHAMATFETKRNQPTFSVLRAALLSGHTTAFSTDRKALSRAVRWHEASNVCAGVVRRIRRRRFLSCLHYCRWAFDLLVGITPRLREDRLWW